MNDYIDLSVIDSPELPATVLISALFEQIHLSLVALSSNDIGISFPLAKEKHLGNKIRLHGSRERLSKLMEMQFVNRLGEFVYSSPIQSVPENVEYRVIQRQRNKMATPSVVRRCMKRNGLSWEEAEKLLGVNRAKLPKAPYVVVQSQSSGGLVFNLHIDQSQSQPSAVKGEFNSYGLSQSATVPWF